MQIHKAILSSCLMFLSPCLAAEMPTSASAQQILPVNGEEIRYTARWTPMLLGEEEGDARAMISATSYVRDDVGERPRPLIFLFNGGPGASSSPLHFTLGPKRIEEDESGKRTMRVNEDSLLVHADLVFIDPVGTGFSRNLSDQTPYWSQAGDVDSVMQYIEFWLDRYGKDGAPLFVAGESYGAFRLAHMMPRLREHGVDGVFLVSPALDFSGQSQAPGNDLPYVGLLPSMAVAAWHHGLTHEDVDSAREAWLRGRDFAETTYLEALHRGSRLDDERERRLADQLSELVGIDSELILQHDLRLGAQPFLDNLLDDHVVGRLDVRVTAPRQDESEQPDRPAGANDPALGVGPDNKILSEPIRDYLVEEIGVDTEREYYSLNLNLNFAWDWRSADNGPSFYVNPTHRFAEVMDHDPDFRMFVVGGYFDLATPVFAVQHTLTRPMLDPERIEFHFLPASHSPFSSEEHRPDLVDKLSRFITR